MGGTLPSGFRGVGGARTAVKGKYWRLDVLVGSNARGKHTTTTYWGQLLSKKVGGVGGGARKNIFTERHHPTRGGGDQKERRQGLSGKFGTR